MKSGHRVVSPRIVRPRPALRVLLILLVLAAIAAAFAGGVLFDREQTRSVYARIEALTKERDTLSEKVTDLTQRSILLQRTQQVDREANRGAQEELKHAQDKQLALEKEISLLRRLIREGGGGIVQIQDFTLTSGDDPRTYKYSFTVSQLVQDFGESEGTVEIEVAGEEKGKEVTLPLEKLNGSKPGSQKMKFRHFQNFDGEIKLPKGFTPENLVVEVKPTTSKLIPAAQTFPWKTTGQ
jgi:hypothetical protein